MKPHTHSKPTPKNKRLAPVPLLEWRPVLPKPATRGGQFICRRFRVAPAIADLVAGLAGFNLEARN